jgi:hypothetical protein
MDGRSTGGAVTPKAICGDLCYEGASELAFALDDKLASGVIDTDLIVRVGPAAYSDALAHDYVRPLDFTKERCEVTGMLMRPGAPLRLPSNTGPSEQQ